METQRKSERRNIDQKDKDRISRSLCSLAIKTTTTKTTKRETQLTYKTGDPVPLVHPPCSPQNHRRRLLKTFFSVSPVSLPFSSLCFELFQSFFFEPNQPTFSSSVLVKTLFTFPTFSSCRRECYFDKRFFLEEKTCFSSLFSSPSFASNTPGLSFPTWVKVM